MRWGLIPFSFWAKDPSIGLRTINAKAETIATAPTFSTRNAAAFVAVRDVAPSAVTGMR